jgi:uncharacterized protein (TIGR03067 family)
VQEVSIDGTWKLVSVEFFGMATNDDAGALWTFRGNRMSGATDAPTVIIYRSGSPGRIDLIPPEGPNQGMRLPGIWAVHGNSLKLCVSCAKGGKRERPTKFETSFGKGDDVYLWIFNRVKH